MSSRHLFRQADALCCLSVTSIVVVATYDYCMSRGQVFYGCVYTELIGYGLCVKGLLHFTLQFMPRGTPIDSIVTTVTVLVNPYTKEGVESLRSPPYTSVNVHVVNG